MSGKKIKFVNLDVAKDYAELVELFKNEKPDTVVHFAEQRAAPYSMKSSKGKRYTVDNNVPGTNNLCCAIVDAERDIHVVHLGTMGVYGYGTSGGEVRGGEPWSEGWSEATAAHHPPLTNNLLLVASLLADPRGLH